MSEQNKRSKGGQSENPNNHTQQLSAVITWLHGGLTEGSAMGGEK